MVELKIKNAPDLFPIKEALERNGYDVNIFLDVRTNIFSVIAKSVGGEYMCPEKQGL